MTEISYSSPDFRIVFLGTNRLPHCDHTLYHYEQWPYSINSSGIFTGTATDIEDSPFPITIGETVVIFDKYYIVDSYNLNQIQLSPINQNNALSASSGSNYFIYNGCELSEIYYTNEILKFRLELISSGSAGGFRILGIPRIEISFTGQNGTIIKHAELREEFSYYSENGTVAYFEFQYTIEGVDKGDLDIVNLVTNDSNNQIQARFSSEAGAFWQGLSLVQNYNITNTSRSKINIDGEPSGRNNNQFTILLKRSDIPGKVPATSDIILGELAVNTNDGKLYLKKEDDSIVSITPIEPQIFNTASYNISSNQNNFELGSSSVNRLNPTTTGLSISGFLAGVDGEIKLLYNAGQTITLLNNSGSSSSGNKILTYDGSNFSLDANSGATILYDGTSGAWRLF